MKQQVGLVIKEGVCVPAEIRIWTFEPCDFKIITKLVFFKLFLLKAPLAHILKLMRVLMYQDLLIYYFNIELTA